MILLYLYIGAIALICIAIAGLTLAAGIIGLASVIRAAFRPRAPRHTYASITELHQALRSAGCEPESLWDPRDVDPAADVFMVAEMARQYGVPVIHYSFEHDGPRIDPSRVSEN